MQSTKKYRSPHTIHVEVLSSFSSPKVISKLTSDTVYLSQTRLVERVNRLVSSGMIKPLENEAATNSENDLLRDSRGRPLLVCTEKGNAAIEKYRSLGNFFENSSQLESFLISSFDVLTDTLQNCIEPRIISEIIRGQPTNFNTLIKNLQQWGMVEKLNGHPNKSGYHKGRNDSFYYRCTAKGMSFLDACTQFNDMFKPTMEFDYYAQIKKVEIRK